MDSGKIGFDIYDAYRLVKFNHFDSDTFASKIKNSLTPNLEKTDTPSSLYLLKSMINHSCLCNCVSQDLGHDFSYILALEDIPKGTEITISYDT